MCCWTIIFCLLNPEKRKEISRLTAEKLGVEFSQVDDIILFYYKHVRKRLTAMDHIAVKVDNLGTFVLKKKRVERKLEKYTLFMESLDETASIRAFETKQIVKKDCEKYQSALDMMQEEDNRKQQVRTKQNEKRNDAD